MQRLRALVRAVRGRRWRDLRDLALAQLALVHAQLLLWLRPVGEFLDTGIDAPSKYRIPLVDADWDTANRWGRAVNRAARLGIGSPQCLVRALALSRLLERHGIVGHKVLIGVRWRDGAFIAHAWVELADRIVGDTESNTSTFVKLTDVRVANGQGLR
jgi:hypothetical protein